MKGRSQLRRLSGAMFQKSGACASLKSMFLISAELVTRNMLCFILPVLAGDLNLCFSSTYDSSVHVAKSMCGKAYGALVVEIQFLFRKESTRRLIMREYARAQLLILLLRAGPEISVKSELILSVYFATNEEVLET